MTSAGVSNENKFVETAARKPFEANNFVNKIFVIAKNAFREAVRDRVLYNLIVFALLLIAAAIFLTDLTDGQEARVILNFGLSAILIFGAFIAIFVGVGLVSKEIERRTVFAIFAKPVERGEFLIGKYLGLCLTLAVNVSIMACGVGAALWYVGGAGAAFVIPAAVYLILLELFVVTATAILFSSFSSPNLSALLTFFVTIIGQSSSSLRDFAEALTSPAARYFFTALYYFLPNFAYFSYITPAANNLTPSAAHLLGATLYAFVYAAILISAAILIFARRNFK
jgi:Cu-processing system permease protein